MDSCQVVSRFRFSLNFLLALLLACAALPSWGEGTAADPEISSDSGSSILGTSSTSELTLTDHCLMIDGVKLHYVRCGFGQPIVLLHGNDGTLQDFTMSVFPKLAGRYQVIAFDRPGHGESKMDSGIWATPADQARIVHDALCQLGVARPLLVAHSWSGAVALSYSMQFPDDLCGIVLLAGMAYETRESDPKLSYYAVQMPVVGSVMAFAYKLTGRSGIERQLDNAFAPDVAPKDYKNRFLNQLFRTSQLKAAARDEITLNPTLRRMSPQYGTIDVPVLIMTGDEDRTVPPQQHSLRLHQAIPDSQLFVVHNAGHELQFTRTQEVLKAIDRAAETASSWDQFNSTQGRLLDAEGLKILRRRVQPAKAMRY